MKTITVQELHRIQASGEPADIIDVRTPAEFGSAHIVGAQLHPLDDLDCGKIIAARGDNPGKPLYLVCLSGARAGRAASKLASAGFSHAVVVQGGTEAWVAAGYPVERGESNVIPLPRQMQLIMGTLILGGVILSKVVDPNWIWLSGFIGAGLIFAGLTDICPMRSVIAKAPWNRACGPSKGASCCAT